MRVRVRGGNDMDNGITIEYREPPPIETRGKGKALEWQRVADELRQHPGEWAYIGRFHPTVANRIKTGVLVAFRSGKWEARTTGSAMVYGKVRADIYVRYLGEDA